MTTPRTVVLDIAREFDESMDRNREFVLSKTGCRGNPEAVCERVWLFVCERVRDCVCEDVRLCVTLGVCVALGVVVWLEVNVGDCDCDWVTDLLCVRVAD